MRATPGLAVAVHADCALHLPFPGHPERPARLEAAIAGAAIVGAEPLPVAVDEARVLDAVVRVHAPDYPARLQDACLKAPGLFDGDDNPVSGSTYAAAVAAVASVVASVDAVVRGEASNVWAPVRPPGHHALRGKAMGFCFFNNVAIAAERLLARGVGPVAIVDFDVHHGNGTQDHFWERSDVFFVSVHRYGGFYPGSGGADEIGSGRGRGFTRNVPLAAGSDDTTCVDAVAVGVDEVLTRMRPAAWLVSAGFDAHKDDPLGGMAMTEVGYHAIGGLLRSAAATMPVLAILEGGYDLEALRRSVRAFLQGLTEAAAP